MGKVPYTEAELIKKLIDFSKELGHTPTQLDTELSENMPAINTFRKTFGTFNNALIAAGLNPNKIKGQSTKAPKATYQRTSKFNKDMLIELLKMKAAELGHTPTWADVTLDKRLPSPSTYAVKFGTYNKAVEAAGLKPHGFRTSNRKKAPT